MSNKRTLLKLGGRKHLGEERWRGALTLFDEVYAACFFTEPKWEIKSSSVKTFEIPYKFITSNCLGLLNKTNEKKYLNWLSWLAVWAMRAANIKWLKNLKKNNPDYVLCSYGDYDKSDVTCLIAKPVIKKPIVRAYKETRPEYSFRELKTIKAADKVVLYDIELKKFLENKYGDDLFKNKKVIIGYDENALPSCILDNIKYQKKFSETDGKLHLVILTFRVDSAPNRKRDQNRYYYIDVIKKLIEAGVVVHLHCAEYNDDNGVNRYEELQKNNPDIFYLEKPLEMKHSSTAEEWVKSCEILSRYDAGLLHNIVDESSVSKFDKINVPHRFFAYEAAHVTPIIEKNDNIVLERMFREKKCGFVYNFFEDLPEILNTKINYYTPSYEDYLKAIFDL
ncbi:MAG: hypothetical protein LUD77_04495 [Clostridiales bacterium]|nr:hypothetical protein [Clostridiales bacterium]